MHYQREDEVQLKTKLKLVAVAIVTLLILFIIWVFNTDFFGRSLSRATMGAVATKYQVPDGAIDVISISFSENKGTTAKNIAYLMEDCTIIVREYRDGFKGFVDSTTKLMDGLHAFKQHECLERMERYQQTHLPAGVP